jgi:translation elongation factor P/translation initiation factor 5A
MNTSNVPEVPTVPEGAKVYFKNLKDGANINSTFQVQMGVDNMKVDTVGPVLAGSGHFHIFIDAEDSLPLGTVVPKDSTHLHYGKGQTEAELTLAPGKHKLTLQFADGIHRSYGGKLATTVNVTVKK